MTVQTWHQTEARHSWVDTKVSKRVSDRLTLLASPVGGWIKWFNTEPLVTCVCSQKTQKTYMTFDPPYPTVRSSNEKKTTVRRFHEFDCPADMLICFLRRFISKIKRFCITVSKSLEALILSNDYITLISPSQTEVLMFQTFSLLLFLSPSLPYLSWSLSLRLSFVYSRWRTHKRDYLYPLTLG